MNDAAISTLGWPIFRPLKETDAVAFGRPPPPVHDNERTLAPPVLAKALVDAINSKPIKAKLSSAETESLALLEAFVVSLGGDASAVRRSEIHTVIARQAELVISQATAERKSSLRWALLGYRRPMRSTCWRPILLPR